MAWHPFRNFGLKAVATALGTLLWLTVAGHQVERRIRVPISYSNVPSNLEMVGEQEDVSVLVSGTDTEVSGFGPGDLQVIVDLGDATPGTNLIALRPELVEAPIGIEVLRVEPGTLTITLERSVRKDVPVNPLVEGQPAEGFSVGRMVVVPELVPVIGPESRFGRPISVVTERIRLDGRRARVEADVSVVSVDSQIRLARPIRVRVSIEILPLRNRE
jgi:YbbR domain-containing protein